MGTLRRTCATLPQPSELRFGVVRAVGRGIAVLDGGPRRTRKMGDGEMFPIRMRKVDNISVRQTYRWKARFVCFLAIYSVSRSKLGFMKN